ncbi:hypothetical protein LP418_02630 [Nocardioides sp. B-3]|nr:hypothetical protein LP418_02630 [Nocardioides sp. B-3]
MAELHDLTALEQGDLVRRGEVTPLDLVEHYLGRADTVGAFVTSTPELARGQAGALAAAGRPDDAGPLWGVPTAIKDLHPTAGVRTTFGSAAYADHVPDESDDVVLTLEAAGLPSLGKTNTPEFGSPCYTEPDVAPARRHPTGSPPHGRRFLRWRGGGRDCRTGAPRTGLGRRWLHPDPGVVLRTGRAQADPWPDQRRPRVRRSGRPGHGRSTGTHGA